MRPLLSQSSMWLLKCSGVLLWQLKKSRKCCSFLEVRSTLIASKQCFARAQDKPHHPRSERAARKHSGSSPPRRIFLKKDSEQEQHATEKDDALEVELSAEEDELDEDTA